MDRIVNLIDNCFCGIPNNGEVQTMKAHIYEHMSERFQDLLRQGKNEDEAFGIVAADFGSMEEICKELNLEQPESNSDTSFINPDLLDEYYRFQKKFAVAIASGVGLILLGVCSLIIFENIFRYTRLGDLSIIAAVPFIAAAVGIFIYYGVISEKYQYIEKALKKNSKIIDSDGITGKKKQKSKLKSNLQSQIMLVATAIFFIMGIFFNAWHPWWAVFPLGGILCGIIDTLF